jgi:putative addiction module component (TIGR02574 family)
MDIATIKEELHQRIEAIENDKVLEAVYILLDNAKNEAEDYILSEADIKELERRDAAYLSGENKGYTLDEFKVRIKEKYGF